MGITLYFAPRTRSGRVRWMLEELGVAYDLKTVDLERGEQDKVEYRRIHPLGEVPALIDDDVVVFEPSAICMYLADRFPDSLRLDSSSGKSRLLPRDGEGIAMPDFKSLFGMDVNLEEEESEAALVQRARVDMARAKQQMLATMVVLGINRIIVTDGEIKASVVFDVKATESSSSHYDRQTAYSDTETEAVQRARTSGGGWFSSGASSRTSQSTRTTVSTANSNFKSDRAEEIEAKAKLTGSVTVKFRSETFPLERMASSLELGEVQKKSSK